MRSGDALRRVAGRLVRQARRVPLVLAAGAAFTLALQALIVPRAFPTADGGLKFLAARQIASGDLRLELVLPARGWERPLWLAGFFPFTSEAVERIGDAFYSRFPPLFAVLSAPFYRLLGYRGLYLLPLLCTWALWLVVWRAGLCLRLRAGALNLMLAVLVFGSPVTLYSALYWEHTPALALAFAGGAALLLRPFGRPPSRALAGLAGALVGLSAFLREEMLFFGGVLLGLAFLPGAPQWLGLPRLRRARAPFVLALGAAWAAFFGFNLVAYGHPLGLHARHFALQTGLSQTFAPARPDLVRPLFVGARDLVEHFPLLLAAPLAFLPGLSRRFPSLRRARLLLLVAAAYWALLHWAVPSEGGKGFGPRLALVVVPLASLALGALLEALRRVPTPASRLALGLLALLALAGAWRDSYVNVIELRRAYAARESVLQALLDDPAPVIVTSHPFVAQGLSAVFDEKAVFMARAGQDLPRLGAALLGLGVTRFLFVCDPSYACGLGGPDVERRVLRDDDDGVRIELERRGSLARYLLYAARARPLLKMRPPAPPPRPAG